MTTTAINSSTLVFVPCVSLPSTHRSHHHTSRHQSPTCHSSTPTQPTPHPSSTTISRRACIRHFLLTAAVSALSLDISHPLASQAKTAPKETIINSVLSAYGLPTISDKAGFSLLTEQYGSVVIQFEHPIAWVVTRSPTPLLGRASGLTASDYRRAEGVALFITSAPPKASKVSDISASFIAEWVTPGDATGTAPEVRVVKDVLSEDGMFRELDTKYESTTVSGYTVERRGRTKATVLKDGRVYALNASCSANRWKKIIGDIDTSLQSFHAFIL